jgi:hypothetical protein
VEVFWQIMGPQNFPQEHDLVETELPAIHIKKSILE